jgi:hypothetical protein
MPNIPMFRLEYLQLICLHDISQRYAVPTSLSIWQKGGVNNGHASQKRPVAIS